MLTALRVALAVHEEHANGLAQLPGWLEAVTSVAHDGLAMESLAAQLRSGRMEHLQAGSGLALVTVAT